MTTLSIQIKNVEVKRKGLGNLDIEIPIVSGQRIYVAMLRAQEALQKPGEPIRYPAKWDSLRQRKAYFASNGFGAGIPYRRTGRHQSGWLIRHNPSPARKTSGYSLVNQSPIAKYISGDAYGNRQSRIHQGRWVRVRDVLEKAMRGLPKDIAEHIDMVARRNKLT